MVSISYSILKLRILISSRHVGRVAVPSQTGGFPALSATSVPLPGIHTRFGGGLDETFVEGEAMTSAQIEEVTEQFAQAAKNVIIAGFDGVEIALSIN